MPQPRTTKLKSPTEEQASSGGSIQEWAAAVVDIDMSEITTLFHMRKEVFRELKSLIKQGSFNAENANILLDIILKTTQVLDLAGIKMDYSAQFNINNSTVDNNSPSQAEQTNRTTP